MDDVRRVSVSELADHRPGRLADHRPADAANRPGGHSSPHSPPPVRRLRRS